MNNDPFNDFVKPAEAAKLLGIAEGTLTQWRHKKRYPLKYIKVGAKILYRRSDILDFLDFMAVDPSGVDGYI